jgi:hypothetical protein
LRFTQTSEQPSISFLHFMTAVNNSAPMPRSRGTFWKTTLLVAGSVAFGGLAVALWNRRELAEMRNQKIGPVTDGAATSDSDEEIF